tara:strand:+ start:7706 stop:8692 length:987 start_codon:yes stop_codon:yes gene_type:complete
MKFLESSFYDYIESFDKNKLSKNNITIKSILSMNNIIIHGAPGVGKYTKSLSLIRQVSPSNLRYEKKISLQFNKNIYYFKISDIHYEIDISLLGCNSKIMWHDIFYQIVDIISAKKVKEGIILCKNFQEINNELLENFYSYLQTTYNPKILIKFIFITSDFSFIPSNILNCCEKIIIPRPSKSMYNKYFNLNIKYNHNEICNIKNIKINSKDSKDSKDYQEEYNINILNYPFKEVCQNILDYIINFKTYKFIQLRDMLYDICIFDLNINNCLFYILDELQSKKLLPPDKTCIIINKLYEFFKLYNNNYRNIYHLEKYILYITAIVNEL